MRRPECISSEAGPSQTLVEPLRLRGAAQDLHPLALGPLVQLGLRRERRAVELELDDRALPVAGIRIAALRQTDQDVGVLEGVDLVVGAEQLPGLGVVLPAVLPGVLADIFVVEDRDELVDQLAGGRAVDVGAGGDREDLVGQRRAEGPGLVEGGGQRAGRDPGPAELAVAPTAALDDLAEPVAVELATGDVRRLGASTVCRPRIAA